MDPVEFDPGRVGAAGADRVVGRRGVSNTEIAERVGVTRPTVISWRDRYASSGLKGLGDEQRSGRPRTVDRADRGRDVESAAGGAGCHALVVPAARRHLDVDASTVLPLAAQRVQPWRVETFKFSTDPELEAKVSDVVGLYLEPPENAVVLWWTSWVGPRRGDALAGVPFPQPALRTGRACLHASGSPRAVPWSCG